MNVNIVMLGTLKSIVVYFTVSSVLWKAVIDGIVLMALNNIKGFIYIQHCLLGWYIYFKVPLVIKNYYKTSNSNKYFLTPWIN